MRPPPCEAPMIIYTEPRIVDSVPIVDLAGAETEAARERIARDIHDACRSIGFFYVRNHGVDDALIRDAFAAADAFFALPEESKLALHMRKSPTQAGYEPMSAQALDSQDPDAPAAPPDLKEAFYCGLEAPDDHPFAAARFRGYGHNQWPHELPRFRETMVAYYAAMSDLGHRLLALMARSLNLPEAWFRAAFDPPAATLRLIKYPPHPEDARFNQLGAGAHTDWGGLTLLAQDSSGGLEVRNLAGEWIAAPPVAGAFVVNLGDLMARWTNDVYASNLHRVKNSRSGAARYSIPFFMSPRPDARVEPIPGTVGPDRPAKYAACTAAEHMAEMFRRSYGYAPSTEAQSA